MANTNIRTIAPDRIAVGDKVRVEQGKVYREAVATSEILSDRVTARHYQVGAPDARGKPIVLGEKMTFLDHKSAERTWYIFVLQGTKEVAMRNGPPRVVENWVEKGTEPDKDKALSKAIELALKAK